MKKIFKIHDFELRNIITAEKRVSYMKKLLREAGVPEGVEWVKDDRGNYVFEWDAPSSTLATILRVKQ